ncbi:MAG: YcxB family protein [Ruminococcaceae bacterium]|nr:YcxB family protein [Oscillospiraceae bacterium]
MEIKAKCKFDFESIRALTHLSLFKKANPKKRFLIWSIISTIVVVVIILEMIVFSDAMLIALLCVAVVLFLLECYLYFLLPKIKYKALAKMKDAENQYIFCDNVLKAFTKSQEYSGEAEIEYSLFVRAYETTKYLFLYQTNNQAFIIDKNTIEGGIFEDIRKKLSAYVKDKYVICKY